MVCVKNSITTWSLFNQDPGKGGVDYQSIYMLIIMIACITYMEYKIRQHEAEFFKRHK